MIKDIRGVEIKVGQTVVGNFWGYGACLSVGTVLGLNPKSIHVKRESHSKFYECATWAKPDELAVVQSNTGVDNETTS
jgi:hypothetical protein